MVLEENKRSLIQKKTLPYFYLKIQLEFEKGKKGVDAILFKRSIMMAMKEMFGEVGASINIDVLKFNDEDLTAILRVNSENYVKLRSALTLYGYFLESKECCAFTILQASQHLISLSVNSRVA